MTVLYPCVSVRYVTHDRSRLYLPEQHDHVASCCHSGAEHQYRPADVVRTDFHGLVRGSVRCLTADRFRLLPDRFWCQNHRKSDQSIISGDTGMFLSPSSTSKRMDITAISAVADQSIRLFISSNVSSLLKIMLITPDFDHRLKRL